MEEMRNKFETTLMRAMIEGISHMGSAFGANEQGEAIFFNARLVDKVGLEMGDIVEAHTIPNYEDKRDVTPWRAVRVNVVGKEDPYATQSNSDEQQIKEYLRNEGYAMTASELVEILSVTEEEVVKCLDADENFTSVPAYVWSGV
jgi:hypothetical protein